MSVNAKLPKTKISEVREFIFSSLIIAAVLAAGILIYRNGDELALTPVTDNQATVIQSFDFPTSGSY